MSTKKNNGSRANARSTDNTSTRVSQRQDQEQLRSDNLRDSPMMAYLMDALKSSEDIGEYGRLTFAIVARHFLEDEEMVSLLSGQPGMDEEGARAMLLQVKARGYNPPKRERILAWQQEQAFPICPNPEDPNACNFYRELQFPDEIYERIDEFWEEKADAEE